MQSDSTTSAGTTPDTKSTPPDDLVQNARDWVLDCVWKEDPADIAEMSDAAILRGVERHYEGGVNQLARDALLEPPTASHVQMLGTNAAIVWFPEPAASDDGGRTR